MNALTCQQVEEQLDLLAAGECDRPTRHAVEHHLETCAACSASYAESRHLQGMLDLHWNEEAAIQRLRQRIEVTERESRRPRLLKWPFLNRAVGLAALLLLTFGLALMLPRGVEVRPGGELAMAVLQSSRDGMTRDVAKAEALVAPAPGGVEAVAAKSDARKFTLTLPKVRDGNLPPLPALPLEIELMNNGARPLTVEVGGEDAELRLDVQGPGVVRRPAPPEEEAAFLPKQTLGIAPGASRTLRLERLVEGTHKHISYVYLTKPGEYTLTIQLWVRVDGKSEKLTGGPVHLTVREQ
jgi:hypothetical protein